MNDSNAPLTLGQVVDAVRQQKARFLTVFVGCGILILIGLILWPKQYGADGKIYVRLGQQNIGLDPTITTSGNIGITDTRESEIRSIMDLVTSNEVLEGVVEEVGADRILKTKYQLPAFLNFQLPGAGTENEGIQEDDGKSPSERRAIEKAVKKLSENLKVESEKKSLVVSIYCTASSPYLARDIINSLLDVYANLHNRVNTVDSRDFFQTQFQAEVERRNTAIQAQQNFRNQNNFYSIYEAKTTSQKIIDSLKLRASRVNVDLSEATKRVEKLIAEMDKIDPRVEAPTEGMERKSTDDTETQLNLLEAQLASLKKRKRESHPDVVDLQGQVNALTTYLDNHPGDRTITFKGANPVFQELEVELVNAKSELFKLQGGKEAIDREIQAEMETLAKLNSDEIKARDLQTNIDVAQANLGTFIQKLGEASVLEQLNEMSISNVELIRPILKLKHVAPRGSIIAPLGILISGLVATAAALIAQRRRREIVVDKDEDLEREIDLPILVSLPRAPGRRVGLK